MQYIMKDKPFSLIDLDKKTANGMQFTLVKQLSNVSNYLDKRSLDWSFNFTYYPLFFNSVNFI